MNHLQGEAVLFQVAGNKLTLSTHRVRYESDTLGSAEIKSIMLEEVASIAMVHSSNIAFLVLAAISLIVGFVVAANDQRMQGAIVVGVIAAIVLAVRFFCVAASDAIVGFGRRYHHGQHSRYEARRRQGI